MSVESDYPELLSELHTLDEAALSRLYEHFAPRIYRYIFRRVGDSELARDLQNDVFVAMLEVIRRDPLWHVPLAPWLFRVARDRTISALRTRSRHRTQPIAGCHERQMICEGPEVSYDTIIQRRAVQRALNTLPTAQRRVLLLRFGYGLSVAEAAAQLGRSEGALRALQHRALLALQPLLKTERPDDQPALMA
jgi:RNA polymerase sigma-70 factor (ECF subfamily)